jgi:hypothetical protein
MLETKTNHSSESLVKALILSMSRCKKLIDKENSSYDKRGLPSAKKDTPEIMDALQAFQACYQEVIGTKDLRNSVNENILELAIRDHNEFMKSLSQFEINLKVSSNVTKAFISSMKNSIASDTKHEQGYNNKGTLAASAKKVLENMPSMAFNNKI